MGNFFTWCAGSDRNVLAKCTDAEKIKHTGFGTLVLIPAVLGLISMSYALSTIDKINNMPLAYCTGGLIWGLIIFAFDRFIVSTHRRKKTNKEEVKNIAFFLRLFFAIVLGIVISHPFVMLYFDGSITEKIVSDRNASISNADSAFQKTSDTLYTKLNDLISRKACLEKLLTAEQSGHKVALDCGYTSGLPGNFIRTKKIEGLIDTLSITISTERNRVEVRLAGIKKIKDDQQDYILKHTSFDYLKRELALEKIKKENSIVSLTQWFLILMFILVDILPVTFKTFAPYGMYDKIVSEDGDMLDDIDISNRTKVLQNAYNEISSIYSDKKTS